jgi:hypothetical protein
MPANNQKESALHIDEVHVSELHTLPVNAISTYKSIDVTVKKSAAATNESAHIYYRIAGNSEWNEAFELIYNNESGEYRVSITGLNEDSVYEVQALLKVDGSVIDEEGTSVHTWSSHPKIGQNFVLASLYSNGQLLIKNMHSKPDT